MKRVWIAILCALSSVAGGTQDQQKTSYPAFDYEVARSHEIKPHRRTIPVFGVHEGFNQLHLTVTVSSTGDVISSKAEGGEDVLRYWPQLEGEVAQWKFTPFEQNGKAVFAEVEEYIDLVPPERRPLKHAAAPALKPNSNIQITLDRGGCFGSCPAYSVEINDGKILFNGVAFTVASGKHTASIDQEALRKLAKQFIDADFYSMDDSYRANVTDMSGSALSIAIDGRSKKIFDYVGEWVGMPQVINDLEDEVDDIANTKRWVLGAEGLVVALKAEGYNFQTYEAQVILKVAARGGSATTVRELLAAGVPLKPFPAPKPKEEYMGVPFDHVGWLSAASAQPEILKILIDAGASKSDQEDKDLALSGAADSGNVDAVKALIAYGANPNADLSKLLVTKEGGGMTMQGPGAGSILIEAAASGNPEMVKTILAYHPDLEARDRGGKTALFAAGEYRSSDKDGARVECVQLLVKAGAKVNARDRDGNTPLHETFLTDVEEELLDLGADVNAKNDDGETPIFTTVDDEAIPLFIKHGANLTIRNKKGETVIEAAKDRGPMRQETLRKAIVDMPQK